MFKGYRSYLFYKDTTNKNIGNLPYITNCSKCHKLISTSSTTTHMKLNILLCIYCGNPCYIKTKN